MERKKLKTQLILSWFSAIAVLAGITAATFAWFSFNGATNVEPMSSTISEGDASLLISNTSAGPFETECTLVFDSNPSSISPVSTSDLTSFFRSTAQNRNGISISYQNATTQISNYLMSGTLYLQSKGGTCRVYFLPSAVTVGTDAQSMAALRLGMTFTIDGQATTHVFRLDDLMSETAAGTRTIPVSGNVVGSLGTDGSANYVTDPAVTISDYMAVENSGQSTKASAGTQTLCTLTSGQIATVQFWVYLEGCDDNCVQSVQSKDIPVRFGFAGIPEEE